MQADWKENLQSLSSPGNWSSTAFIKSKNVAVLVRPQHQMVIPKKAKVALEQGLFINGISGRVTKS